MSSSRKKAVSVQLSKFSRKSPLSRDISELFNFFFSKYSRVRSRFKIIDLSYIRQEFNNSFAIENEVHIWGNPT